MTKEDFHKRGGRKFGCLPDDLQALLLSTVVRLKETMNQKDLAYVLANLADLEFDLTSAPSVFRDTMNDLLQQRVRDLTAPELSRLLWGLAAVNVPCTDSLSSETQRYDTLSSCMNIYTQTMYTCY